MAPEIAQLLVVLIMMPTIYNGISSALRVDIVPETVDDLSTDTVTITCGATESPDGTRNVVLMELGKRGEHPLVTLGKTKLKYGANKNSGMEARGSINEANTSQSYLHLTIKNPGTENGGVYVCRLFYVDGLGELKDVMAYGNMTVQSSSKTSEELLEDLFTKLIQNLTDKVTSLEKHSKEQGAKVTSLLKTVTDQDKQLQEQTGKVTSLKKTVGDQEKQLQEQTKHSKEQDAKVTSLEKKVTDQEKQLQEQSKHSKEQDAKESFVSAFSAKYNAKNHITAGKTLVFSRSVLDVGHDYNTATGVYTAPKRGLYLFTLVVLTYGLDWRITVFLQANGRTVASLYAHDKQLYDQSSVTVVVSLQAGDQVKPMVIKFGGGNTLHPLDTYSLFTGYLLKQL